MKIVATAFGHQSNLATRRTSLVSVVGRGNPELLNGIERYRKHRSESVTARVVDLNSVYSHVALITPCAVYRSFSRIPGRDVVSVIRIGHAWLQTQQFGHVPPF